MAKEVKITLREARDAANSLGLIASTKIKSGMNMKFVMAVKRAMDVLSVENRRTNETMIEMSDDYVLRDENGVPVPSDSGDGHKIDPKKRVEYIKLVDELLDVEFTMQAPIEAKLLEEFVDSIKMEDQHNLSMAHIIMVLPITY